MTGFPPERRARPDPTLVQVAGDLGSSVTLLNDKIELLAKKGERRRNQMLLLGFSILFDLALSIGLFFAVDHTNNNQEALRKAVNTARTACEATNESSSKQVILWEGVLNLTPSPGRPPPDPKVVAEFRRLLNDTFRLRDCTTVR